ncbi:MAG TPA: protein tyrosine phosphatase [Candidatus Limnocylindria bacterium]|jgi:predicted protein tyrosine phosphatase|nr:protein tyrosine phosphatase [Candidatus Limnocylindria bacterium]
MDYAQKLLFICSRNRIRSLTAEMIFRGLRGFDVRSAGTQPGARIVVSEKHIQWADIIFVMERSHQSRLESRFADALAEKVVVVLQVPDVYDLMEPDLVSEIWHKVAEHIPLPQRDPIPMP